MMFILRNKNNFLLLLLLSLTSCNIFIPKDPVEDINEHFLQDNGNLVRHAREKHEASVKNNPYKITYEKTAMGKKQAKEQAFLEENMRNKPYISLDTAGGEDNVKYLSYNNDAYRSIENDYFKDVKVDDDDFKHYDMGTKEYIEIGNKELQNDYDEVKEANKVVQYKASLKELKQQQAEQEANSGFLNTISNGLKNFGDKLKNLLK